MVCSVCRSLSAVWLSVCPAVCVVCCRSLSCPVRPYIVRLYPFNVLLSVIALQILIYALFALYGCLLLYVVVYIRPFKAVLRLSVALSFRLGTFIRLYPFYAVIGQNKSFLLLLLGCMRARVIIIY